MQKRIAENFLYIISAAMILLVLFQAYIGDGAGFRKATTQIANGWYYMEGNERIEVTLPATIYADVDELVLYHETAAKTYGGELLSTKGALYKLEATLGDTVIFQYDDSDFPRNRPMEAKLYCDMRIPDAQTGILAFHYQNTENGVFKLNAVYAGAGNAIFRQQCCDNALIILLVFFFMALSILSIAVFAYFYIARIREWRLMNIAAFLFICGIWVTTDSALGQIMSGMIPAVSYISFYAFMLMPVPMVAFIRNTTDMEKHKILDVIIALFCLNVVMQSILNYNNKFDFIDMLYITHILLGAAVIIIVGLLVREYRRTGNEELKLVGLAFTLLGISGILALLLYWILDITFYELLFEAGILIFVSVIFYGLLKHVMELMHYRTEMRAFERLSAEDLLTGLCNRKAYDEYLEKMEQSMDTLKDALLIYLKMDNLKLINDQYGHNTGDESIVLFARCIKNVFGSRGNCYRIGGDEFCVVVLNPSEPEEHWKDKLQSEMIQCNKISRYRISFHIGSSNIRDEGGMLKTISDWKYEANQKILIQMGWFHEPDNYQN